MGLDSELSGDHGFVAYFFDKQRQDVLNYFLTNPGVYSPDNVANNLDGLSKREVKLICDDLVGMMIGEKKFERYGLTSPHLRQIHKSSSCYYGFTG